jgi:hypothetical protein
MSTRGFEPGAWVNFVQEVSPGIPVPSPVVTMVLSPPARGWHLSSILNARVNFGLLTGVIRCDLRLPWQTKKHGMYHIVRL